MMPVASGRVRRKPVRLCIQNACVSQDSPSHKVPPVKIASVLTFTSSEKPTAISGLFSFTYLLYLCEYFSSVGASYARDLASKR